MTKGSPPLKLVKAGYCGPTSWYRGLLASHGHMVRAQPPLEENQKAADLEDLVVSLDLPSVESLEDKGALTSTVASLVVLLPVEHLAAWEALSPINAADQGVTATTAPEDPDSPIHLPQHELLPGGGQLPCRCWPIH